jgi:4-amino-4-deoxy-L-arabinose transferase-like glycosyltransferase
VRAATVLFGGWLLVDGLVLSYMHGTVHPYYSLSIAPAVAAMFAIGLQQAWVRRESHYYRLVFVVMSLGTGVWSWWVLGRNAHWLPALRWVELAVAVLAAVAALGVPARRRVAASAAATVAVAAALAGSGAYAFATAVTPHHGGGPSVGPARRGALTAQRGRSVVNVDLDALLEATHTDWSAAVDRSANAAVLELATHTAVMAIGGFSGLDPTPTLAQFQRDVSEHRIAYYVATSTGSQLGRNARSHNDIARWVAFNYVARRVGTDLVFDLTAPPRQP